MLGGGWRVDMHAGWRVNMHAGCVSKSWACILGVGEVKPKWWAAGMQACWVCGQVVDGGHARMHACWG